MTIDGSAPPLGRRSRRLTQLGPAVVLGLILVLIPGLPAVAAGVVAEAGDDPEASGPVVLESLEGQSVSINPPAGWQVRDRGSSASFRSGEALVAVEVHDRNGRDVDAMAERIRRKDRLFGISAAPHGGHVATGDGALSGNSCILTTEVATGTCAVVADDDVLVFVQSLGTPDAPAQPLAGLLDSLTKVTS